MKAVIINKSDSTGGAAIVSFRLMQALRTAGVDASLLVAEKKSDSQHVHKAASDFSIKEKFFEERLSIFWANGFDRCNLFKVDSGEYGLPLWKHPEVVKSDIILLGWVNQGLLSLKGIKKISDLGKPIIWIMHDLWEMTGICHHPGSCIHYHIECGLCKFLGKKSSPNDLSNKIWQKKESLYNLIPNERLVFVAVSTWLAKKARESSLLNSRNVYVIPNPLPACYSGVKAVNIKDKDVITLLFGAARIDDPIKDFNSLVWAIDLIKENHPELAGKMELVTFGNIRNPEIFKNIAIKHRHAGFVADESEIRKIYENGDILVSSSEYETLPTTLVEAQLFGCIPVSFDKGGQSDIITHGVDGFLAKRHEEPAKRAQNLAIEIINACGHTHDLKMIQNMHDNATKKFSPHSVARFYISLMEKMLTKKEGL